MIGVQQGWFRRTVCRSWLAVLMLIAGGAEAQMPGSQPQGNDLFAEDLPANQDALVVERKKLLEVPKGDENVANIRAPNVSFDKDRNRAHASGGVLVSRGGVQVQADEVSYDLSSDDAELTGQVLVTGVGSTIAAERGTFNLESELGSFEGAEIAAEGDGYFVSAEKAGKTGEYTFEMEGTEITSCRCPDGDKPWTIGASSTKITEEGYAYCRNASLNVGSVPVLYTPIFAFPAKRERQSGLLMPMFGFNNLNGFQLRLPYYGVIDDSTDITFTPMIETRTRNGAILDFRKEFSLNHKHSSRFIYSNERPRDGSFRGTLAEGAFDPTIEDDRFGAFVQDTWRSGSEASVPWSVATDVRYVGDDLLLRELQDSQIADRQAQYATSRIIGRATLGEYGFGELATEYNQSIISDDDFVLQRLPELTFGATRQFRPFGYNPLGARLNTRLIGTAVRFDRREGYDGWRLNVNPGVSVPFHYKNYLQNQFGFNYNATSYRLDETSVPGSDNLLDDTNSRSIWQFTYQARSSVERVYQLDQGNWLTRLAGLGVRSQSVELKRLKHTIEPFMNFSFVPDVDQADLPLFDSFDRMRERGVVTFGFSTRLLGRFTPYGETSDSLTELTPLAADLPEVSSLAPLSEFGFADGLQDSTGVGALRAGQVRELASLTVRQSYDYIEERENNDPQLDAWSDLGTDLSITPNQYVGFTVGNNFNVRDSEVSAWGFTTQFTDDRGDIARIRYTYIRDQIGQVDGNLELKLNERLKLGYYARYDDREAEFIENRFAVRFKSACNCWHVDLGFNDRINPDNQEVMLNFGLAGLGNFGQALRIGGGSGN